MNVISRFFVPFSFIQHPKDFIYQVYSFGIMLHPLRCKALQKDGLKMFSFTTFKMFAFRFLFSCLFVVLCSFHLQI